MKRVLLLLLISLLSVSADLTPQERYIRTYKEIAVAEMERSGVPASITLAQGMLESGNGQSELAVKANNHFGIKCHNDWKGKTYSHDDDAKGECFRVYPDPSGSFRDHSDFLRYRDRYKSLFELDPSDYKGWSNGLLSAGYATDRQYASKLIRIIEDYRLYELDVEKSVPDAPSKLEEASVVQVTRIETYRFSLARVLYENNGVPFIYALQDESFESIARSYGFFLKEILKYNDAPANRGLSEGEIVYLEPKKSQASKGLDKYVVGADGESLRDIAQRFGIRESSLRRLNRFNKDYSPCEGDTINLR